MTIPVFYDPRMVADAESYSPSMAKPQQVFDDWINDLPIKMHHVTEASDLAMSAAHKPGRVSKILRGEIENGFGNTSRAVADALPWSVGSMVSAAIYCAAEQGVARVACSPSSGFHHAGYDYSQGFCTINGLIVAAMALKRAGLAKRVTIIDCDYHYGDGTQDIIDQLGLDWITHWSAGQHFTHHSQAKDFLSGFTYVVKHNACKSDVVLYQAGADQHVNDPLGGLLTTEQMIERDRTVFWICREYNRPLAWNLAGGYQRTRTGSIEPVLQLHRNTMQACVDIWIKGEGRTWK